MPSLEFTLIDSTIQNSIIRNRCLWNHNHVIARTLHTLEYYIINGHSIGLQTRNGRRFPWGNGGNCPRRKTPHRAPRGREEGGSSSFALGKKVKVAHTRLPSVGFWSWSRFLAVSLHVMWVINPAAGCHYFPPGLQLPLQPLRGLLPISLLGEQRHSGCEQFT